MVRTLMCMVLFTALLRSEPALACNPSFKLINTTNMTIRGVYTREHGDSGWSVEHLGPNTVLSGGYNVVINLRSTDISRFDLDTVFLIRGTESHEVWSNIGLCRIVTMTISHDSDGFHATYTY